MCAQMYAQGNFVFPKDTDSDKIKFKLINNLIVFPIEINGVALSFLLDTGVSRPIVFNVLNDIDTLKMKHTEKILLQGLGDGEPINALRSRSNILKVGDALNVNQELFVILDNSLDFAPNLGVPIHGIIGYDLFKDFVVEINYSNSYFKLYKRDNYTYKSCKTCEVLDLEFYKYKPYLNLDIENNSKRIPLKLLIDSGGSDALWLFEDGQDIESPELFFEDFLGNGLSGSVYGKRSKIEKLFINGFILEDVNVAYPDSVSIAQARKHKERNGSIAGELLKRFNLIVDYNNKKLTLKKNGNFKKAFEYNKSGISLEYGDVRLVAEKDDRFNDGRNYTSGNQASDNVPIIVVTTYKYSFKPAFTIVELRKDSPAHRAGLQIDDVILTINGKASYEYTLQEMLSRFYGHDGKKIKLKIDRNGHMIHVTFRLENLLKQKNPSNEKGF